MEVIQSWYTVLSLHPQIQPQPCDYILTQKIIKKYSFYAYKVTKHCSVVCTSRLFVTYAVRGIHDFAMQKVFNLPYSPAYMQLKGSQREKLNSTIPCAFCVGIKLRKNSNISFFRVGIEPTTVAFAVARLCPATRQPERPKGCVYYRKGDICFNLTFYIYGQRLPRPPRKCHISSQFLAISTSHSKEKTKPRVKASNIYIMKIVIK